MKWLAVVALVLSGCAHVQAEGVASEALPRGAAFWRGLKDSKFAVPAGVTRAEVLRDAVALTDAADPSLRDDVGYGLVVQWVYRDANALTPAELETFTSALMQRMQRRPSSVLGRSFSALSLSLVAAAEVKSARLSDATFAALVEAACVELESEDDLRGHDATRGWLHATAHTADLLKFLARDSRLTADQQARMFKALRARLERPESLSWGEDERLAMAVRSLALRSDGVADFEGWVAGLEPRWKALWNAPALDRAEFQRLNSIKQVLRSLVVVLGAEEKPAPAVEKLRGRLAEVVLTLM